VVIVDTPPWSAGSGTRMIAATAGAAVLLVRAGRSHAYETRMVTQELANANVNVLGIAFNEP
jgi:Mrp family chromosome partitioning ATPase